MLKPSMYQLMVNLESEINLKQVYAALLRSSLSSEVVVNPPGSLGVSLSEEDVFEKRYVVGSIRTMIVFEELNNCKVSVLLFKQKMKISGGFPKGVDGVSPIQTQVAFDAMIQKVICGVKTHIFHELADSVGVENVKVSLINGNMNMNGKIPNFMNMCFNTDWMMHYKKVVMPKTANRGRICAIKLYVSEKSNASVQFDSSGKLQFFAFKTIDEMIDASVNISNIIILS
jgi:hypothetical protein